MNVCLAHEYLLLAPLPLASIIRATVEYTHTYKHRQTERVAHITTAPLPAYSSAQAWPCGSLCYQCLSVCLAREYPLFAPQFRSQTYRQSRTHYDCPAPRVFVRSPCPPLSGRPWPFRRHSSPYSIQDDTLWLVVSRAEDSLEAST